MSRRRLLLALCLAILPVASVTPEARAVSGAERVDPAQYPWFVSVGTDQCAGALVAPDRVVTTTSCAEIAEYGPLHVGGVKRRATGVSMLPQVTEAVTSGRIVDCGLYDDTYCLPAVALLRLDRPVAFAPIPLAEPVLAEPAWLLGHGTTRIDEDQTLTPRLRRADVHVLADEACRQRNRTLDRSVLTDMPAVMTLCTEDQTRPRNAGLCVGDDGAPLIVDRMGGTHLAGIGMFAILCGEDNAPSVFMETWLYRDFVLNPGTTWRPRTDGYTRISGRGRVGSTLRCRTPRMLGQVERTIYWFLDEYEDRTLQRGESPMYKIKRRDRGLGIMCWAYAINPGGARRIVNDEDNIVYVRRGRRGGR